jgi:hypothetical protein
MVLALASASLTADIVQITAVRLIYSAFAIDLFYIRLRKVSAGRENTKSRAYLYIGTPVRLLIPVRCTTQISFVGNDLRCLHIQQIAACDRKERHH